jgi:hypothetical protein
MSSQSKCEVTTYDDGDFIRVAIVVPDDGVSFDLLDDEGVRIAEINAFVYRASAGQEINHVIVDIVDKDDLFNENHALTFLNSGKNFHRSNRVICADFKKV